jgi:hypothetical protein
MKESVNIIVTRTVNALMEHASVMKVLKVNSVNLDHVRIIAIIEVNVTMVFASVIKDL